MKIPKATFRLWKPEDKASLVHHAGNIKIWNNVRDYFPHPYTEKDADEFINYCLGMPEPLNYAIDIDGNAVGGIGIVPGTDVEKTGAEIGYWLGEEYWGKGIMSGIVADFSSFIFRTTPLTNLYTGVFAFNKASMRVLEKAGFAKIGVRHKAAIKNGAVTDMHYYEKVR